MADTDDFLRRFNLPGAPQPLERPPRPGPELGVVEIGLPKTVDTGLFARYIPFNDKREIIARRGTATGHHYGFEQSHRPVNVSGREYEVVMYRNVLSPPPRVPAQPLLDDPEDSYHPVYEVLYLPGVEVMFQRSPASRGFSDAEIEHVLKAIRVT